MKEQCDKCEYGNVCFAALKFVKKLSKETCKQGRKIKEPKVKNAPTRIDTKVETV